MIVLLYRALHIQHPSFPPDFDLDLFHFSISRFSLSHSTGNGGKNEIALPIELLFIIFARRSPYRSSSLYIRDL